MRPVDPRLLRHAQPVRGFLTLTVVLGLVQIGLIIAFCALVSGVVVTAVEGVGVLEGPWVVDAVVVEQVVPGHELLGRAAGLLAGLAAVVAGRAVVAWAVEAAAVRAAVRVKSELRSSTARALVTATVTGQAASQGVSEAHAVTVLGAGLDALDAYFSRYLPQLVLTVLAVPILLSVLALADLTTAVIVALTMPLVPVFMVLIGWATQAAQQRQWRRLDRLGTAYLDVVEGLSTLKIFNRQHRQRQNLRTLTEAHRRSTMKVLRYSFLSGFALELAASLSVALVAVSIGVRLIDGELGLFVGLFVLMVVPEAYNPLRQVGAQYHAAADGVAAAQDVFALLERGEGEGSSAAPGSEREADGSRGEGPPAERLRVEALCVEDLRVRRGDCTVLDGVSFTARGGELTVITGPSGAGKSTLFAALLGFVPIGGGAVRTTDDGGAVRLDGGPLRREHIAWTGQRHGLRSGTVAENITLGQVGDAGVPTEEPGAAVGVARALADVGLADLDPARPLGVRGAGLSGGQAHRVAVARALHRARTRGCPVLLLDEPSAALDAASEAHLLQSLRAEASSGRIVLVISHRPALVEGADQVIRLPVVGDAADVGVDRVREVQP